MFLVLSLLPLLFEAQFGQRFLDPNLDRYNRSSGADDIVSKSSQSIMDTGKTSIFNFKGHTLWTRTLPTDWIVPVSLPCRSSSSWPFAWDCASGLFVQSKESCSMASEFGRGWICLHPRSNNLSRRWRASCHCIGLVCVLKSSRLNTHTYIYRYILYVFLLGCCWYISAFRQGSSTRLLAQELGCYLEEQGLQNRRRAQHRILHLSFWAASVTKFGSPRPNWGTSTWKPIEIIGFDRPPLSRFIICRCIFLLDNGNSHGLC